MFAKCSVLTMFIVMFTIGADVAIIVNHKILYFHIYIACILHVYCMYIACILHMFACI